MDWTFSRTERWLMIGLCGVLVLGGALLGWQQWRVRQARHELNNYLMGRAVPWSGDPGDGAMAGGVASAVTRAETAGEDARGTASEDADGRASGHADQGARGDAGGVAGGDVVTAGDGTTVTPPPPLIIHVAGAVHEPGVVLLPPAARAVDAVDAAGGATGSADLDRVNLAAPLVDGQRLYIPRKGEIQVPGPAPGTESGSGTGTQIGPETGTTNGRVDVNQADASALQRVPGIGPVLATRIITYRTAHGPFQRLQDLTKVSGIGARSLENMAPYLYVNGRP